MGPVRLTYFGSAHNIAIEAEFIKGEMLDAYLCETFQLASESPHRFDEDEKIFKITITIEEVKE